MKILVTFALENEFAPFRKLSAFKRVSVDGRDKTYEARVGSVDVRVILTGAGRFAAERAMAEAFAEPTDICVTAGLSGALRPEYALSDVLVAREVTDPNRSRMLKSDDELIEAAAGLGARPVETFIVTAKVVSHGTEKRDLGSAGDAVDMESLYVISAAARHRVRAVAIRAISDAVDSDLPLDFTRVFRDNGDVSLAKVVGQLATHPQRLPALLRLAHDSQRAAAALASFLIKYIQSFETTPLREISKADAIAI